MLTTNNIQKIRDSIIKMSFHNVNIAILYLCILGGTLVVNAESQNNTSSNSSTVVVNATKIVSDSTTETEPSSTTTETEPSSTTEVSNDTAIGIILIIRQEIDTISLPESRKPKDYFETSSSSPVTSEDADEVVTSTPLHWFNSFNDNEAEKGNENNTPIGLTPYETTSDDSTSVYYYSMRFLIIIPVAFLLMLLRLYLCGRYVFQRPTIRIFQIRRVDDGLQEPLTTNESLNSVKTC